MNHHPRAAFALLAAMLLPCAAKAAGNCSDLLKFAAPGITISKARDMAASTIPAPPGAPPIPLRAAAHCRVEGIIGAHKGPDGKSYGIRFAVAMPPNWNGRLLYQGGGGLNGSVQPPLGATAAGDSSALSRGFAVVSSDSGHEGAVFDASFFVDQQATLDFLYQSVSKVMAVAKPLIAAHYEAPITHSYFVGCSTGGREAMISSQRDPNEFDGIVAGAPAMRTNYSNLALRWITASLNAAAPKDAQGRPLTAQAFSDSDRKLIVDALLRACDALDGVKDGMIFNSRRCAFDPRVLQCKSAKSRNCLSRAQVEAIRRGFSGPKTTAGIQVYPGFPYDTGIAYKQPGIPGLLFGGSIPVGPAPSTTAINVDEEAAAAHDAREMAGDTDAWTNLTSFAAHGGKLIFYHGMSDPWFSALDTVGYYQHLSSAPTRDSVRNWSRLFLVPGMSHCNGGQAALDRFDMLTAIVDWVEKGQAPERITATGAAFPGRSRPLCAYPKHAQYRGAGNPEAAANFSCED